MSISDHLPSFSIFPNCKSKHFPKKYNIFKRNFSNLKEEDFTNLKSDFNFIDWDQILHYDRNDVNLSFDTFFTTFENILDKYCPLRKVRNKDFKNKHKPWITKGILISIKRRDKLFGKYIRAKNKENKTFLHNCYKELRNKIITLIRESKFNHFKAYFQKNSHNIKNLWAGINQIVNIKSKAKDCPTYMEDENGKPLGNPDQIANNFNKYFSNIAENILKK